jgi:hypothetical protein
VVDVRLHVPAPDVRVPLQVSVPSLTVTVPETVSVLGETGDALKVTA